MSRKRPASRKLRVLAVDPCLIQKLDTRSISQLTLQLEWEELEWTQSGFLGEYFEVVTYDWSCRCHYQPATLDDRIVLIEDGLPADLSDARFHQQMVYAVASQVVQFFERVLGRPMQWSSRNGFLRRLKLYPYAFRDENAYYSPGEGAILFGYFAARPGMDGRHFHGETVFTSLCFDIVVHETVHALLDGLRPGFLHPTNPDVRAFHEAFADLVALLLRFSFPELLEHELKRSEGQLLGDNVLLRLGHEFGLAVGRNSPLRSAVEWSEEKREWVLNSRPLTEGRNWEDSYERGAVLVAAILEAFLEVYKQRTADLIRIAKRGHDGQFDMTSDLDLVKRLAWEASDTASGMLRVCVRALDYTPPVDITFSDYLRAVITASRDHEPIDTFGVRVALVESCRVRQIFARELSTMTEESLVWKPFKVEETKFYKKLQGEAKSQLESLRFGMDRETAFLVERRIRRHLKKFFATKLLLPARRGRVSGTRRRRSARKVTRELGLVVGHEFEVESVRPARRPTSIGWLEELVVVLRQKFTEGNTTCHGGSTLLIEPKTGEIKYCIGKYPLHHTSDAEKNSWGATGLENPYR